MSVVSEITRCPYCREKIMTGAVRCKHCQVVLGELKKKKSKLGKLLAKSNNFRTGFLSGILFMIVLGWLVYLQFFAK